MQLLDAAVQVDVDFVFDPLVNDRIDYVGKLYKQIEQLDFSRPVLEALLAHKEKEVPFWQKPVGVEERIFPVSGDGYRPAGRLSGRSLLEQLFELNDKYGRLEKIIVTKIVEVIHNFYNFNILQGPVGMIYYTRSSAGVMNVEQTVTELRSRLAHTVKLDVIKSLSNDDYLAPAIANEIITYYVNQVVDTSCKMDAPADVHESRIFHSCFDEFVRITERRPDYALLGQALYSKLIPRTDEQAMLFGVPVFKTTSYANSITFGLNPNTSPVQMSGYLTLSTMKFLESAGTLANPIDFTPTKSFYMRDSISKIGGLDRSIITFMS